MILFILGFDIVNISVDEEVIMAVSYKKLMIDKNINKTKLRTEIGISSNAMANLGKNKSVQVEVLVKICNHLNCTLDDILEILPNENEDKIEGK
jgi:putative transcriptional regulator